VVVGGSFSGSVDLSQQGIPRTANGTSDGYVVKLDGASGGTLWTRQFGGVGADYCQGVAIASIPAGSSNEVLGACIGDAGTNASSPNTLTFEGNTITGPANRTSSEAIVARFSSVGEYRWGKDFGGPSLQQATDIAFDASSQRVIVGGTMTGSITLDTMT